MANDEETKNGACGDASAEEGPDLELFETWVKKHYGENSRTKTITGDKYSRICQLIRGEDLNTNAKFRFWVRSKGFRLINHDKDTNEVKDDPGGNLVVSLHAKEDNTPAAGDRSIEKFLRTNLPAISFFRKVATVEEFYGIIKGAHIDIKGVHAGQKKTYRLVSDTYAFLPREVITYYLLNCNTCKPRIQKYGPIHTKVKLYNLAAVKMSPDARSIQEDNEKQKYTRDASTPGKVIRPSPKRILPAYMNDVFAEGYIRSKQVQQKDVNNTSPPKIFDESNSHEQTVDSKAFQSQVMYTKCTEAEVFRDAGSLVKRSPSYPSYSVSELLNINRPLERNSPPNSSVNTATVQNEYAKMPALKEEHMGTMVPKGREEYTNIDKRANKHGGNDDEKRLAYESKNIISSHSDAAVCSSSCCSYLKSSMDSFEKMKERSEGFYGSRMQPYRFLQRHDNIRNYIGHTTEADYKKSMLSASYNNIPYFLENKDAYMDFYHRNKQSDRIEFPSAPSFWNKRYVTSADSKLESWKFLQERAREKTQCI